MMFYQSHREYAATFSTDTSYLADTAEGELRKGEEIEEEKKTRDSTGINKVLNIYCYRIIKDVLFFWSFKMIT